MHLLYVRHSCYMYALLQTLCSNSPLPTRSALVFAAKYRRCPNFRHDIGARGEVIGPKLSVKRKKTRKSTLPCKSRVAVPSVRFRLAPIVPHEPSQPLSARSAAISSLVLVILSAQLLLYAPTKHACYSVVVTVFTRSRHSLAGFT